MSIHSTGATTPSEKFSARLSMAARATPASSSASVSRPTMCDTASAPALGARLLERIGNTRHVFVQASLRYQRAGQEPHADQPERQQQKPALDDKCDHGDDADDQKEGDDSKCAPLYRFRGVAVEMPLQHADQTADPGDRMTD